MGGRIFSSGKSLSTQWPIPNSKDWLPIEQGVLIVRGFSISTVDNINGNEKAETEEIRMN